MLLQFNKRRRLSILSSSMRIKFQLLPLISVINAVEVSTSATPSAAAKYSSATYTSWYSGHFSFPSFSRLIPIYLMQNIIILFIFSPLFLSCRLWLLITLIFSFSSCWFFLIFFFTFSSLVLSYLTFLYIHTFVFIVLLVSWIVVNCLFSSILCEFSLLVFCLCWTRD